MLKFSPDAIVVSEADLGIILEKGGLYADDAVFMKEATRIARQSLTERSAELTDVLDQPFGKGLLEKLNTLSDATDDELSRMLHLLPSEGEVRFSYDHIQAIKAYVIQRIVMFEEAVERSRGRVSKELHDDLERYRQYLRHIENYFEPLDIPELPEQPSK